MTTTALLTLVHALVWVYWLGGDLGAFCASFYATNPSRTPLERRLALELVNVVDTAPAVALVLTLPTGVSLAMSAGWLPIMTLPLATLWILSLTWLWVTLRVHRKPGPATRILASVDTIIRVVVIGVLGGIGLLTIAARWQWLPAVPAFPLFIGIKCAILAIATYCGLRIRAPLRTFISAFSRLTASTDATLERELHRSMQRCRGFVVTIWACLVLAAFIGMLRPL